MVNTVKMTREVLEHCRHILERIAANYEGSTEGKMISNFITCWEEILWGKNSQYSEFCCCLILGNIHTYCTLQP